MKFDHQFTRAATIAAASYDEDAQTVEAVASTFADVQRRDGRGAYTERVDPAGLDQTSIVGAPLLDGHRQGSSRDVIGIVQAARIEAGKLIVTLRLSQAADAAPTITRIQEGLLRVSIGYSVIKWADSVDPITKTRTRTAAAWRIQEVSAVAVPADRGAHFRHEEEHSMENEDLENRAGLSDDEQARIRSIGELADLPPSWAEEQITAESTQQQARAAARAAMVARSASTPRSASSHPPPKHPPCAYGQWKTRCITASPVVNSLTLPAPMLPIRSATSPANVSSLPACLRVAWIPTSFSALPCTPPAIFPRSCRA